MWLFLQVSITEPFFFSTWLYYISHCQSFIYHKKIYACISVKFKDLFMYISWVKLHIKFIPCKGMCHKLCWKEILAWTWLSLMCTLSKIKTLGIFDSFWDQWDGYIKFSWQFQEIHQLYVKSDILLFWKLAGSLGRALCLPNVTVTDQTLT